MAFDWREYLELAKAIKDLKGEKFSKEASQRSAVSRAYYSAYGFALSFAERFGYRKTGRSEDHGKIVKFFRSKGLNEVSESLRKLRKRRNVCNYENRVQNIDKVVEHSIKLAEKIIQTLS